MDWTLDKSRPICPQLCERICVAVAKGTFLPGEKLLSVREIALAAGVNPKTVQKAFEELERQGVIHSVRCSGWYVNDNIDDAASAQVDALRVQKTREYLAAMAQLGCTPEEIAAYLKECQEEEYA